VCYGLFKDSPTVLRRVALCNLSRALKGQAACLRLNETKSAILEEIEQLLTTQYEAKLELVLRFGKVKRKTPPAIV
jgi:hypothetical protein